MIYLNSDNNIDLRKLNDDLSKWILTITYINSFRFSNSVYMKDCLSMSGSSNQICD